VGEMGSPLNSPGGAKLFVKNGEFVVDDFRFAPGSGLNMPGAVGDGGAFVVHLGTTTGRRGAVGS